MQLGRREPGGGKTEGGREEPVEEDEDEKLKERGEGESCEMESKSGAEEAGVVRPTQRLCLTVTFRLSAVLC